MMVSLKLRHFPFLFLVSSSTASKPHSSPSAKRIFSSSFSTLPNLIDTYLNTKPEQFATLTQEEICKINLLIPRLCVSNHLTTAIQLTTTALLTNPPPNHKSLSLSILLHFLALHPDLKPSMLLLKRLSHIPQPQPQPQSQSQSSISTMLIASYLKMGRPKDALKVYNWMVRPGSGSPCNGNGMVMADKAGYGILVGGLCANGLVLEGLRVLRDMLRVHLLPGEGLRKKVVRSLLREARINEAKALEELLPCVGYVGGLNKVLDLLDLHIENWTN